MQQQPPTLPQLLQHPGDLCCGYGCDCSHSYAAGVDDDGAYRGRSQNHSMTFHALGQHKRLPPQRLLLEP